LEKSEGFKQTLKERGEIDVRGVKVRYGVEGTPDESLEAVAAVSRNVEDLFSQCGRLLGEGLHTAYLKARVASAKGSAKSSQAKLELAALLDDEKAVQTIEATAGKRFGEEMDNHKASIRHLPEARRDVYRKLRRQAAKPEPEELELPQIYEGTKEEQTFTRHLYVDEHGELHCKLNDWETSVVEAELATEEVIGWLRNVPRKTWAFKVPYTYDGEDHAMYPDFLFFRRQGDGVVVDILEPHSLSQDDSAAKARGLADFALRHGDNFGRIELIIKEKDKLLRLDMNQGDVRDKVRAVSDNQHLRQLFESVAQRGR